MICNKISVYTEVYRNELKWQKCDYESKLKPLFSVLLLHSLKTFRAALLEHGFFCIRPHLKLYLTLNSLQLTTVYK